VTVTFRLLLIWIAASAVAFVIQLNWMSATYTPEGFVPVGNDAFYHARRIIDTARDPAGFYEFDSRIHAPEGSLLVWPWGYDFAMGMGLRAGASMGLAGDPMKFLAYVPPFAVLITIALVIAIARALGLSLFATFLLALCVALSPLTQGLHGIGSIDHHFAEYMVILALMASALSWMRNPDSAGAAAATAAVLGAGPAVHNGLFVLQVLLVATVAFLWARGQRLPGRTTSIFGMVLTGLTLAILLPSLPFRLGLFDFYLLSWFHLYVACGTAIVMSMLARTRATARAAVGLALLAVLLAVPLIGDALMAGSFVGKEAVALEHIKEAQSLWSHIQERGVSGVARIYSSLIYLAPIVWLACAYALFKVRDRRLVMVCIHALLTVPLMFAQFRFQYYGSLALYLPMLVLADRVSVNSQRRTWLIAAACLLGVAYYPAVRSGLAGRMELGNDVYYGMTRLAMPALAEACREEPGIVLARSNEGHYIRYHTECSVISNNFLLTEQHFEAVRRVGRMFDMSPQQLLDSGFPVKYVFVRARGVIQLNENGSTGLVRPDQAPVVSDTLTDALLWGDPALVPPSFKLLKEVKVPGGAYQYARIWKIDRPGAAAKRLTRSPASSPGT